MQDGKQGIFLWEHLGPFQPINTATNSYRYIQVNFTDWETWIERLRNKIINSSSSYPSFLLLHRFHTPPHHQFNHHHPSTPHHPLQPTPTHYPALTHNDEWQIISSGLGRPRSLATSKASKPQNSFEIHMAFLVKKIIPTMEWYPPVY